MHAERPGTARPAPPILVRHLIGALLLSTCLGWSGAVANAQSGRDGHTRQNAADHAPAQAFAPQRPDHVPPQLWEQLLRIDRQLAEIDDFQAHFIKHKHTPLLKRPLVSTGVVRAKDRMMRWDTHEPSASTILMRDGELRLYQPRANELEIYPLGQRFALFGASPQPRLTAMVQRFNVERKPPGELFEAIERETNAGKSPDKGALRRQYLALRLIPREDELREHVETLEVLIDREAGHVVRLRLRQDAGESTVYHFTELRTNVGLPDEVFELDLPAGVRISRPLEGRSE